MHTRATTTAPDSLPAPTRTGDPPPLEGGPGSRPLGDPPSAPPPARMTAVVQRAYGGPEVLAVEEVATPTPAAGEVLIDVRATDVSAGDIHLLTGRPYLVRAMGFGLRRPSAPVPGRSFAGVVRALGPGVTSFEVGDAVLGNDERSGGALAEFNVARADELFR
ncbi:MAG: alcohol dehydrogenase catalytic domain-containing protein, partial [Planctomycetota bacterium]